MNDAELYEHIFCSQYGAEHREELVEEHRDRLPSLEKEHQRSGVMKVRKDGTRQAATPFHNLWGIGLAHEMYMMGATMRNLNDK